MDHAKAEQAEGVGGRVRTLRTQHGLKQQDLASRDASTSYISLIESGKRLPSAPVLATLAERLGTTPEYLLTGRDEHRAEEARMKLAFAEMALRNGDDGEAMQAFSDLLADRSALDESMIRRARIGQATALEKTDRLEAAIALLDELHRDPAISAGSDDWCRITVALCRSYRNAGDISLSIDVGERAVAKLDALGLDTTMDHIQVGSTLMSSYHMRGDLTRAQLLGERLLPAAEAQGSYAARGSVYWSAGLVARSQGRLHEAISLTERALAMMAEGDNVRHIAILRMNYGVMLLQSDPPRPEHALDLLQAAQESLAEVGTASELIRCELNLADTHKRLGHLDTAAAHAQRALGLLGTDNRILSVRARTYLAEICLLRDEREDAVQHLHAADRQQQHFPASRDSAQNWRRIGDLWQQYGDTTAALKAYDKALSAAGLARTGDVQVALTDQH
ncbi:helix-turn-helix domain-containing protein [Streptomyces sp. SID8379]|uniref:helix-turn-helix domain-containing protein n=1 Tax=unclassified Streptomyces TaxID=2593676 RepID=UPI000375FA1E|nr:MULTISPECIES: helix-turn-helix domain-containing protein [unclassified Streptomyces]MYW67503.1 helix-turn-helix domain-containing protein [Streptomyces sp. SID8379]